MLRAFSTFEPGDYYIENANWSQSCHLQVAASTSGATSKSVNLYFKNAFNLGSGPTCWNINSGSNAWGSSLPSVKFDQMLEIKLNRIEFSPNLGDFDELVANAGNEDALTLISQICSKLENLSVANFLVSGFGQQRWPVDLRTDLAVILEQLRSICEKLDREDYSFSLDFYEQGIERYLSFRECDELRVEVKCRNLTKWQPEPETELISKLELKRMFLCLMSAFKEISDSVFPALASQELFQSFFEYSTSS